MARDRDVACYIDTSALVKRYVEEDGSDDFELFCERPAVTRLICPLGQTEFASVMRQRVRSGALTSRQTMAVRERFIADIAAGGWRLVPFDIDLFAKASDLIEQLGVPLATLDALHLACAMANGASEFATADRQLAVAARKAKLQVHFFAKTHHA